MDSKDFASLGEADQLDFAYRFPLYSTMELFIETLTGTCFELRVSPYETVISVKAKIQRLEGIPITQQYLIWHDMELEDDYCLHDYNITDGCTLKLVLAMRGGPINTRRIAMEDTGMREMADYVESNQEELFEKLSPPPPGGNSNKQVTLLVYRDGDQLNFFRVVDRGDGTLTPFTESLSGSACNLREEEDDTEVEESSFNSKSHSPPSSSHQQPLSAIQMMENNLTASKMKQLRTNIQNLNIGSKKAKQMTSTVATKHVVPRPPSIAKAETDNANTRIKGFSKRKDSVKMLKSPVGVTENAKTPRIIKAKPRKPSSPSPPILTEPDLSEGSSSLRLTSVSRSSLLRARLRRSKNVTESTDESRAKEEEVSTKIESPISPKEVQHAPKTLSETTTKPTDEDKGDVTKETADDVTTSESDRLSPRTKRLLNALDNQTSQTPRHLVKPAVAKATPRSSSLLQGLTYNRHDMYLRSYGLIPSPEDDHEEETIIATSASSSSEEPSSKGENPPISPHVYETTHGVKYSSVGSSLAPYHWGGRFLKSPPAFKEPYEAPGGGPREPSAGSVWRQQAAAQKLKRNSFSEIPDKRPHFGAPEPLNSYTQPQKGAYFDKRLEPSRPKAKDSLASLSTVGAKKVNPLLTPQPPTSNPGVSQSWQKQRLKRMNSKPSDSGAIVRPPPLGPFASALGTEKRSGSSSVSDYPAVSPRRPLRDVTSKSGLRMKESSNGKVESMSRQEAREVVDFINKAMDASILRSLVRSPVKDVQRGNSGQASNKHHHNLDANRTSLKSSHGGAHSSALPPTGGRVPSVLPPVKPPSKKKRCFLCAKRTGLASSYVCRCGKNFCATHRYAEMHSCTYDYKTAGRKLLEEANPLVSAPKLPKI